MQQYDIKVAQSEFSLGKLGRDAEFLSGYGAELVSSKTQRNACSLPPGTLTQVLVSLLSTSTSKTNIKMSFTLDGQSSALHAVQK